LAKKFFACDQLVVLIDPTALLAGGVGVYSGCRHMLDVALRNLSPGQSAMTRGVDSLVRFLTGGHGRLHDLTAAPAIRHLAIVASQADKVHRDDQDKLRRLLQLMVEPLLEPILGQEKKLTVGYFVCSAVFSSESRKYPNLEVLPLDEKGRPASATREVTVSKVPDNWPKDWKPNAFVYPDFAPIPPANPDYPPTQVGLNKVASFILGTT
jgi:predicted YcjX-like family ATPase